eukprot:PhF_6_TR13436/c0_g2_i3/m.21453
MMASISLIVVMVVFVINGVEAWIVPPRNVSYQTLNVPALQPRPVPYDPRKLGPENNTWVMTSTCVGTGIFSCDIVTSSSNLYGLFDIPCGWTSMPGVGEWGYEFHNNQNNIFPTCGNLTMQGYSQPPANRSDALHRLKLYWECQAKYARSLFNASSSAPLWSMMGHYFYTGLSAWFEDGVTGSIMPGSEVGENINSVQAHIAFVRGAGKQFGAPTIMDVSTWMQGFITDYSVSKIWGQASSPVGGHSLSFYNRVYTAIFMSGINGLVAEAGAVNWFYENKTASGGQFLLSPLGEIGQAVYKMTHPANGGGPESVRGISYVPIALITEVPHGMGLGWWYRGSSWDTFPLTAVEIATSGWMEAMWGGSFLVENQFNTVLSESGYMVGGWDDVDIVLPFNLSHLTDAQYRVAILPGMTENMLSNQSVSDLINFVNQGGTVVLAWELISTGLFPKEFLGVQVNSVNLTTIMGKQIRDLNDPSYKGPKPVCVQVPGAVPTYYIRAGGNPHPTADPTILNDKCCRQSSISCYTFYSLSSCQAALNSSVKCWSCGSGDWNIGCPMWPGLQTTDSAPSVSYGTVATGVSLKTAKPWMTMDDTPVVVSNLHGKGQVVSMLLVENPSSSGITPTVLIPQMLQTIRKDVSVIDIQYTGTAGLTLEVLVNAVPLEEGQWIVTVINNHGVIKQPNSTQVIDPTKDIAATLCLKQSRQKCVEVSVRAGEVQLVRL